MFSFLRADANSLGDIKCNRSWARTGRSRTVPCENILPKNALVFSLTEFFEG